MSSAATNLLQQSLGLLEQDRFKISTDVEFEGNPIAAVAHRSRFELLKFGNCETFFVFCNCPSSDESLVRNVSAMAFNYAKANKSFPMPCGLFESVFSFSVLMVPSLDPHTAESIRSVAPKMRWAAAEIPVLFDCSNGHLCYFEKTPMWGAMYYKGFRTMIQTYLGGAK